MNELDFLLNPDIVQSLCAFAVLLVVTVANQFKKKLKNTQNVRYTWLLRLALLTSVLDILSVTLAAQLATFSVRGVYLDVVVRAIVLVIFVILLSLYALALLELLPQKAALFTKALVAVGMIPVGMFMVANQFVASVGLIAIFLFIQKPEQDIDLLTGVFNAVAFRKSFLINRHRWRQNQLILIYIEDVAVISRVLGMSQTNQILNDIGKYLEGRFKGNVYFLGNEMFALLLAGDQDAQVRAVMRSLDERFYGKWKYDKGETNMTARLIEMRLPEDAHDLDTVYSYGDYLRTLEAGHKWILYARTVDMQYLKRRIDVDKAIRRAIEKGDDGFEMYYQPIYNVAEGRISTAEALVRLWDEELGRISPAEFIPIAEQGGVILQLSEIIFHKVFAFIARFDLLHKGLDYVEINLSIVQCMQEDFADTISKMMNEHNISNNRINLEVTETAAVSMPRRLRENMQDLYSRGIRFSLDDFGTGYSNIDSLMDLPIDMIKLDKSIIDMATAEDKGKIVLASAIAMAKRINMKIVAEGVETGEQKAYLEEMGVDFLQGYFFSYPLPEDTFISFVEEFNA